MRTLESFTADEAAEERRMEAETVQEIPASDGFVIQEIEMKDFMRYVGETSILRFPKKFTVITGKTGSGKTSILDAVTFALYKRTSRTEISGIGIADICGISGHVKVYFAQGGNLYEIERGFSKKGSPYLHLYRNGSQISGSIPELEAIVKDTVGLDYDGFRNSTFVRQEEMKELGVESASNRLRIFQKLFRLEIFEKAQALAKTKYDEIRREIEIGEHDIEFLRERLSRLPEIEEEASKARREARDFRKRLRDVEKRLLSDEEKLRELEREHEAFISARASVEEKEKSISNIQMEIEKVTRAGEESTALREEIKKLEDETKDYEKLLSQISRLKETGHLAASLEKEKRVHQKSMKDAVTEHGKEKSRLQGRLNVTEGRIASLSTTVDKDEAFDLLRTEGALGERISRIEKEIGWLAGHENTVRQIKTEKVDALSQLDGVTSKVQEINEDSFVLSEIENQVGQIKRDLKNLEVRHKKKVHGIDVAAKKVDRELEKLDFDEKDKSKLKKLEESLKEMGSRKGKLRDCRQKLEKIGDVSKLIDDLKRRLKETERDVAELKKRLKKLASDENRYQNARRDVENLKKSKSEIEKELRGKEVQIESLASRLKELEEERKKLEKLEKTLEEGRSSLETFAILKDQVFHKKGVAMYAINQLLPELEIETSQNLIDLTDGRFTRVSLKTHEEKREYGIRIEVEGVDGRWHDVAEFSGGERTQINAALRFAIARQLASLPQVGRTYGRMKTLFIDEGDLGSLDTESNRDLFIHKLFKMGEFFDKVILITHLVEVADKFPGKIRVYMTPEQESRIEVVS
ncbi:MAG: AAA family ATPase [Thermoplasmata archaeon]